MYAAGTCGRLLSINMLRLLFCNDLSTSCYKKKVKAML